MLRCLIGHLGGFAVRTQMRGISLFPLSCASEAIQIAVSHNHEHKKLMRKTPRSVRSCD